MAVNTPINTQQTQQNKSNVWKYVIIAGAVGVGVLLLYIFSNNNNSNNNTQNNSGSSTSTDNTSSSIPGSNDYLYNYTPYIPGNPSLYGSDNGNNYYSGYTGNTGNTNTSNGNNTTTNNNNTGSDTNNTNTNSNGLSVLIPAYWGDSSSQWSQLEANHPQGTIAIAGSINPNDPQFTQVVNQAHQAGIKVIGYVYTHQGTLDPQSQIDKWYQYPIDGIFVDEVAGTGHGSFYQQVNQEIKQHSGGSGHLVVINPGWNNVDAQTAASADVVMSYESGLDNLSQYNPQSWQQQKGKSSQSAIVENVSQGNLTNVIQQLQQKGFGYVALYPDSQNYGALPNYWNTEVQDINSAGG